MEMTRHIGHSYSSIRKGIYTAIMGKGVGVVTSFVAVPLAVRYLGAERYGVWITLSSLLTWLTVFDLGVGSTAINKVSESLAHQNFIEAKLRINAAYLSMAGIAFVLAGIAALAWPFISWPLLLGVKNSANVSEISMAAGISLTVFLINLPLSITTKILGACNKVASANYWNSTGSGISLPLLLLATHFSWGLPGLVLAFSGSTLLVGALSTIWLYRQFEWLSPMYRGVPWQFLNDLFSSGLPFFAVQIAGLVLFQTDNLIIAQLLGVREVTPYSITWKLFSYSSLLQVTSMSALWPAYSNAFARKDFTWVRKTYRYNLQFSLGTSFACVAVLVVIARQFIKIWAGSAAVPSFGLVVAMGVWSCLVALCWCQSCLLGAAGRVKGQAIYSSVGAVVNVVASIYFGRLFGLVGIITGTILAYLFCIVVPQTIETRRITLGQ